MMLLAIAVIGIAGGALAFKAQKFGSFELYGCDTQVSHACDLDKGAISGTPATNGSLSVNGLQAPDGTIQCTTDADCGVVKYNSSAIQ